MPPTKVELTIIFDTATGQITVNAPFGSLPTCYAMLEMAKDICRQQANMAIQQAKEQRVQLVEGMSIPNFPNKN